MTHTAFTPAWADAFREAINADPDYRATARRWRWPVALVADPDPDRGLIEPVGVRLELRDGECRAAAIARGEAPGAAFILRGPMEEWKALIQGDLDPLMGLLHGRLRLERGSLARLVLHTGAIRALALCATRVPTLFPEPVPVVEEPELG